jgi:chromosome segregation ATPase
VLKEAREGIEARIDDLSALSAEEDADLKQMITHLRDEAAHDRSEVEAHLKNLDSGAEVASAERQKAREAAVKDRSDLEQMVGDLREQVEARDIETGERIDDVRRQVETLSKGTADDFGETRDLIATGHDHFSSQVDSLSKALEDLRGSMEENQNQLRAMLGKLRHEVENIQVELEVQEQISLAREEARDTRGDFDVTLTALGEGRSSMSALRDEMNRLRGKAAWLREQFESRPELNQ